MHPNTLERRHRKAGIVWPCLLPFISAKVLEAWAVNTNRNADPCTLMHKRSWESFSGKRYV